MIGSGIGAASIVWHGWRHRWRAAVLTAFAAATAALSYWVMTVPQFDGSGSYVSFAVATLIGAIVLPGAVGAVVAQERKSAHRLAAGLSCMLVVWLPLAYLGLFTSCGLDPRCDL